MDIQRVNAVLEKAIVSFQEDEIEAMAEATAIGQSSYDVPGPTKKGTPRKRRASAKPRVVKNPKNDAPPTVDFWRMQLVSYITQYDMKVSRRERSPNIYRLGHLLGAAQRAEDKTKGLGGRDDEASLKKYLAAVKREFEPDFPPLKRFEKAVNKYLSTGRRPKYGK
jgi:hypothetical protein